MKVIGIIAEYNPLHYGHEYQLRLAREKYNADVVVVVMSGNFTQRGTPAILDKHERASLAISAGADLVVELPSYFSSGILDDFAFGAVSVLEQMGCIDELLFGSECGEVDVLSNVATAMNADPETYKIVREGMRRTMTYELAEQTVLSQYATSKSQYLQMIEAINMPNNMLGIFYIIALLKLDSTIVPITNERVGQAFSDDSAKSMRYGERNFVSATAIRKYVHSDVFLKNNTEWYEESVPEKTRLALEVAYKKGHMVPQDAMFRLFVQCVLDNGWAVLENKVDIDDECKNRIIKGLQHSSGYTEFIKVAANGLRSGAKIDRCITHVVLNHSSDVLDKLKSQRKNIPIKLLSFTELGQTVCNEVDNNICRSESYLEHLEANKRADDIYNRISNGL